MKHLQTFEKRTSIEEMGAMKKGSPEWFEAAFENMPHIDDKIKEASMRICHAYGIWGQADPGYIANVIDSSINAGVKFKR